MRCNAGEHVKTSGTPTDTKQRRTQTVETKEETNCKSGDVEGQRANDGPPLPFVVLVSSAQERREGDGAARQGPQ